MKIWYLLAGAYLCYCWGVIAFYVASFDTLGIKSVPFADRISYAVKWPLAPIAAPFIFLYILLLNRGTLRQKAEAASRLLEQRAKPKDNPFTPPRRAGKDYVQ